MKINSKFLVLGSLAFILVGGLVGCNPSTSEPDLPPSFSESVEANLVEDQDYVEHSKTYSKNNYDYDESKWFVNNLDKVPLPDPQIYVENDTYYIVGTSDRTSGTVIDCYSTKDFFNFDFHPAIYEPKGDGWESDVPYIYAPEIYKFDGVYYMYYSAIAENGVRYNSVVQADSVLGPYEAIVNDTVNGLTDPVFQEGAFDVLDATIFVDDDGKMYMYYATSGSKCQFISGVELVSPYEANWDTKVDLVKPGEVSTNNPYAGMLWEMFRSYYIAEAPFMIKHNGKYIMTYSVNGCWNKYYNVCYAIADSPLGNFEKPYAKNQVWTNLLLGYPGTNLATNKVFKQWAGFASGTGHHCFFKVGDQIMIAYHAHKNRDWDSETAYTQRYFAFDYLYFDKDGNPYCNGPTYSPQPMPEGISGYKNIALDAKVRYINVENAEAINDNYIVDCYNLPQEAGKEVKLGNGYSFIELTFDKEYEIGGIAIYNSAYYDQVIYDVAYVDYGNGNAHTDLTFLEEKFVNHSTEFVFPNSAFTVDYKTSIKTNKVVVAFNLAEGGSVNEIAVLGK